VDKAYDTEGVHVEDCLVEAEGKDYRSFAVEGKPDDVKRFLATHPVGQKLYAQATADVGAILHGYPGFVCKCAGL
jgi:cytochrome b involved in lipid metabolism